VQQDCGCVIGKDYPKRVVDHDDAVKENMGRMKLAYADQSGGGDDEEEDSKPVSSSSKSAAKAKPNSGTIADIFSPPLKKKKPSDK
jgi:cryptochrome